MTNEYKTILEKREDNDQYIEDRRQNFINKFIGIVIILLGILSVLIVKDLTFLIFAILIGVGMLFSNTDIF